jgi:hypothetical protein
MSKDIHVFSNDWQSIANAGAWEIRSMAWVLFQEFPIPANANMGKNDFPSVILLCYQLNQQRTDALLIAYFK